MPYRYTEESGVRVTQCESWDDFIHALRAMKKKPHSRRIYRGHALPDWKLSSTWERHLDRRQKRHSTLRIRETFDSIADYRRQRDKWLNTFKRLATSMPEIPSRTLDTDIDWLAFGRHYGLNTPLLDWSQSPYIAAFWAFAERVIREHKYIEDPSPRINRDPSDKPVVIWELFCSQDVFRKREFRIIDNARYELHRQCSQMGVFTYLEHDIHVDIESYLASRHLGSLLERYEVIFKDNAASAISDLERMNIHFGTILPDPHGAAKQANLSPGWKHYSSEASSEEPTWDLPPPIAP